MKYDLSSRSKTRHDSIDFIDISLSKGTILDFVFIDRSESHVEDSPYTGYEDFRREYESRLLSRYDSRSHARMYFEYRFEVSSVRGAP